MSDSRAAFETFISLPPHEKEILRFPDDGSSAWPGSYKNLIVDLAWDAWQASRQALEGEPVAWWDGDTSAAEDSFSFKPNRCYTIPLYTHPASADKQAVSVPEWQLRLGALFGQGLR